MRGRRRRERGVRVRVDDDNLESSMFLMGFWERGVGLGSVILVVCDMFRTSLILRGGVSMPCMVI